jgi:glycosyltransferase involved in cell wall biosynthesis
MTGRTKIASQPGVPSSLAVAIFLADQNPHRDRSRGITEMTRCLVDQIKTRDDIRLIQIVSTSSFADPQLRCQSLRIPWRTDRPLGRLCSDALHPLFVRPKADVWYYPKGYLSLLATPSIPTIGTMHDTIVQHYADHYSGSRHRRDLNYWINVTKRSLRNLNSVLTVSQHAKGQLLNFCDRYRITPPTIAVTYESSEWEKYIGMASEKAEYVVHLASDAPHKKTNHLLQMWTDLQRQAASLPPLKIIGALDAAGKALLSKTKQVEQVEHLPREELVNVLGESRALILPSEIEGFGLPALESYYVSTPVCYVRNTSVEEVIGTLGACCSFDLNSPQEFLFALNNALSMPADTVKQIRDNMYARFAGHLVADKVVEQFYRAAGKVLERPSSVAPKEISALQSK